MDSEDEKLPYFKYHPEPLKTDVFEEKTAVCPVCKKKRKYVYVGPIYSLDEIEDVCPWCIKDGSAAEKYDLEFQDKNLCEKVEKPEYLDELIHRTPGYLGWQPEVWLSHCGDFCAYKGNVGWDEIKHIAEELRSDIERIRKEMNLSQEEFQKSLIQYGSHQGYLFKCLKCGKHRLASDME